MSLPPFITRLLGKKNIGWILAGAACLAGMGVLYLMTDSGSIGDSMAGTAAQMVVKLALVLGLLYLCLNLLKRWQGGVRRTRQLAIVETLRLSPRQALHLVRAGDRLLLIGGVDAQISLLAELQPPAGEPAPAVQPVAAAPAETFAAYLAQLNAGAPETRAR